MIRPEQEQIVGRQLASGLHRSVDEVLDAALANLPPDRRSDPAHRCEAIRRMIAFGAWRKLSFGEPATRQICMQATVFSGGVLECRPSERFGATLARESRLRNKS